MTGDERTTTTVGQLPNERVDTPATPARLTGLAWLLWVASVAVLGAHLLTGATPSFAGVLVVDGLTAVLWVAVTFFSGIVHSYSRRYMAGSRDLTRFFTRVFGFTLTVMVLVAAANLALFAAAWLAMGLLMADLVGYVRGWPQAQAAGRLARRYFVASSVLVAAALALLWWATGATTVAGVAAAVGTAPTTVVLAAAGLLVLAAMIQSALVPFHTWLLASMTAPTPASALMHAGFVNAGGILLVRFAPVVTVDPNVMLLIVLVGATSALLGKVLKSVQPDVKRQLGCSTVGQMGFMLLQAGLGFFAAVIAHLVLHGFYKAYLFLSSGEAIDHTSPASADHGTGRLGVTGIAVTLATGLAGGAIFALVTGKGTSVDSGLLLTGLVVLMLLHASRTVLQHGSLPAAVRYVGVPLVFLPTITLYAAVYVGIETAMAGLPVVTAPTELTVVHGVVAAAFGLAYLAIETGVHQRSRRLYVALLNASQPPAATLLTATEEYNEY